VIIMSQIKDVTGEVSLPLSYHDAQLFAAVHTASYDAVAQQLPTGDLTPARWLDRRALVMVSAARYHTITWGGRDEPTHRLLPYAEVMVAALVTEGTRSPVRALLELVPQFRSPVSGFVLQLPVTTRQARDVGRRLWGLPKFVADMSFALAPQTQAVTVAEGGRVILSLTVRLGGRLATDTKPLVLYSVLDGQLIKTVCPSWMRVDQRTGRDLGELALGEHEVGQRLRELDLSTAPVMVTHSLEHRGILPAGSPIGPAHDYVGCHGHARKLGHYTVQYPDTDPLDQYAPVTAGNPRHHPERIPPPPAES
jgi:hypothetical protein